MVYTKYNEFCEVNFFGVMIFLRENIIDNEFFDKIYNRRRLNHLYLMDYAQSIAISLFNKIEQKPIVKILSDKNEYDLKSNLPSKGSILFLHNTHLSSFKKYLIEYEHIITIIKSKEQHMYSQSMHLLKKGFSNFVYDISEKNTTINPILNLDNFINLAINPIRDNVRIHYPKENYITQIKNNISPQSSPINANDGTSQLPLPTVDEDVAAPQNTNIATIIDEDVAAPQNSLQNSPQSSPINANDGTSQLPLPTFDEDVAAPQNTNSINMKLGAAAIIVTALIILKLVTNMIVLSSNNKESRERIANYVSKIKNAKNDLVDSVYELSRALQNVMSYGSVDNQFSTTYYTNIANGRFSDFQQNMSNISELMEDTKIKMLSARILVDQLLDQQSGIDLSSVEKYNQELNQCEEILCQYQRRYEQLKNNISIKESIGGVLKHFIEYTKILESELDLIEPITLVLQCEKLLQNMPKCDVKIILQEELERISHKITLQSLYQKLTKAQKQYGDVQQNFGKNISGKRDVNLKKAKKKVSEFLHEIYKQDYIDRGEDKCINELSKVITIKIKKIKKLTNQEIHAKTASILIEIKARIYNAKIEAALKERGYSVPGDKFFSEVQKDNLEKLFNAFDLTSVSAKSEFVDNGEGLLESDLTSVSAKSECVGLLESEKRLGKKGFLACDNDEKEPPVSSKCFGEEGFVNNGNGLLESKKRLCEEKVVDDEMGIFMECKCYVEHIEQNIDNYYNLDSGSSANRDSHLLCPLFDENLRLLGKLRIINFEIVKDNINLFSEVLKQISDKIEIIIEKINVHFYTEYNKLIRDLSQVYESIPINSNINIEYLYVIRTKMIFGIIVSSELSNFETKASYLRLVEQFYEDIIQSDYELPDKQQQFDRLENFLYDVRDNKKEPIYLLLEPLNAINDKLLYFINQESCCTVNNGIIEICGNRAGMSDDDVNVNLSDIKNYVKFLDFEDSVYIHDRILGIYAKRFIKQSSVQSDDERTKHYSLETQSVSSLIAQWKGGMLSNSCDPKTLLAIITLVNGRGDKHAVLLQVEKYVNNDILFVNVINSLSSDFGFKGEFKKLGDSLLKFGIEYQVLNTGEQDEKYGVCGDLSLIKMHEIVSNKYALIKDNEYVQYYSINRNEFDRMGIIKNEENFEQIGISSESFQGNVLMPQEHTLNEKTILLPFNEKTGFINFVQQRSKKLLSDNFSLKYNDLQVIKKISAFNKDHSVQIVSYIQHPFINNQKNHQNIDIGNSFNMNYIRIFLGKLILGTALTLEEEILIPQGFLLCKYEIYKNSARKERLDDHILVLISDEQRDEYRNDFLNILHRSGELITDKDGIILNEEEFLSTYNKNLSRYINSKKASFIDKAISYIDGFNNIIIIVDEILKLQDLTDHIDKKALTIKDEIYGVKSLIKIENAIYSLSMGQIGISYSFGLSIDVVADALYLGYSAFYGDHSEFTLARDNFSTSINSFISISLVHSSVYKVSILLGNPVLGSITLVAHATSHCTNIIASRICNHNNVEDKEGYMCGGARIVDDIAQKIVSPITLATDIISLPIFLIEDQLGLISEDTKFTTHIKGLEICKKINNILSIFIPKFVYDIDSNIQFYQNKIDQAKELIDYKKQFTDQNGDKLYDKIYKPALQKKHYLINSGSSQKDADKWMMSKIKHNIVITTHKTPHSNEDDKEYHYKYDTCFELNSYADTNLYHCYSKSANTVDELYGYPSTLKYDQYSQIQTMNGYMETFNVHLEI